MSKKKMIGKILLVPDLKGQTLQIHLFSHTKWLVGIVMIFLVGFITISIYQFSFYQKKLYSLMNEQNVTNKSMNEMSMDGIQTKREIMRLKYEVESLDKFIASANSFEKDAKTKLSIPFSSMTFADYFRSNTAKYDQAHPASTVEVKPESPEDIAQNLLDSQKRQARKKALMDVKPSGYPLIGKMTKFSKYINGPGVSIICPVGTPIHTTASGKIYQIKNINKDCYIIEILHENEKNNIVKTIYYFCYKPVIKIGQKVKKGQLIAYSGIHPLSGDNVACYQVSINKLLIQPK